MYAIPRANDCVFGGTNELSDERAADPAATARIVAECSRILHIDRPKVIAERVGLRPFRKSGVRLERVRMRDGAHRHSQLWPRRRRFTLSWGCARKALNVGKADFA